MSIHANEKEPHRLSNYLRDVAVAFTQFYGQCRIIGEDDDLRENRQVGLVDAQGKAAAHTGNLCHDWAGHKTGDGYSVQGNLLAGEGVIESMSKAFLSAQGELADRLVAALRAGDIAGGDRRGKQSAAVQVVRPNGGYGGDTDRYLDLRVDDHAEPVLRLAELVDMHHLYFQPPQNRIFYN